MNSMDGPPNYWLGFVLNLLFFGAGHLIIREVTWGMVWFAGAMIVNLMTGFTAMPLIVVGVLVHYHFLYVNKYRT